MIILNINQCQALKEPPKQQQQQQHLNYIETLAVYVAYTNLYTLLTFSQNTFRQENLNVSMEKVFTLCYRVKILCRISRCT